MGSSRISRRASQGERLGDLGQLLFADAQPFDRAVGWDRQVEAVEQGTGFALHARRSRAAPKGVWSSLPRKMFSATVSSGIEVQFLVDDRDAVLLGVAWVAQRQAAAFEKHLALVVRVDAAEDLHQGGFAGAVLADQRVDFARLHGKRDVAQRLHTGKALADGPNFEHVCTSR